MQAAALEPVVHALFARAAPFLILAAAVGLFLGGIWRWLEQGAPRLINSHRNPRPRRAMNVSASNRSWESVPDCPMCNVPMVKRVARHGPRTGMRFWGCSNYPMCRCTKDVMGTALNAEKLKR